MSKYKITVLELGYDPHFPAGIAFDFWNMSDQQIYSQFSMTLLQGEGHNILFDCGFDPTRPFAAEKIKIEGDQNCHNPSEVLQSVGVKAEDIDSIVISHAHWDHMSGLSYFPNAKIYIQSAEIAKWKSALKNDCFPVTHKSVVDPENFATLDSLSKSGRIVLLCGDEEELFPGINIRMASGHSYAQNMLFVDNDGEHYAVIGDVCMRPESFQGTDAFPCYLPNLKFAVGTIESIVESYHKIMQWVDGDISHIIMTHDGTCCEKWLSTISSLGLHVTSIGT